MFHDTVLCIASGMGTFGKTVLRGFLKTDLAEIHILSRDEKKQEEISMSCAKDKIKPYIGGCLRLSKCLWCTILN